MKTPPVFVLLSALLALLLPMTAPASAQFGGGADPEVTLRVVPQQSVVSPGGQLAIAVVLDHKPGWHSHTNDPVFFF